MSCAARAAKSSVTHRATKMTDPHPAAASADAPAAAAATAATPRKRLLGTGKKRRRTRPRPEGAAAALCELKPAQVCFKCAYAAGSGCTEGTDGSDRGYRGAYHAAGRLRGSRTFDFNHWEQYCQTHWRLIMGNSESSSVQPSAAGAAAAGTGDAPTSAGTVLSSGLGAEAAAAAPAAAAAAAASTAIGAGAAHNGEAAVANLGRRHPAAFPDPSGTDAQLHRLSQLYFGGKPTPTNEDADAAPSLEKRKQRHTNLKDKAVTEAVNAVVLPLRDGIPLLRKNGELDISKKKQKGVWLEDRSKWPGAYMKLEDPGIRAERCKGAGGWTAASKELARKHHLVSGTVVLLHPEVSGCIIGCAWPG